MLQMNKIYFGEDSLDLYDNYMPELRNNCFMYVELLLDFAITLEVVLGMICVCYCKGQPCNPNQHKSLFSLAYAHPFPLMCETLLFLRQIGQVLWDGCKKTQYGMTLLLTFCK